MGWINDNDGDGWSCPDDGKAKGAGSFFSSEVDNSEIEEALKEAEERLVSFNSKIEEIKAEKAELLSLQNATLDGMPKSVQDAFQWDTDGTALMNPVNVPFEEQWNSFCRKQNLEYTLKCEECFLKDEDKDRLEIEAEISSLKKKLKK